MADLRTFLCARHLGAASGVCFSLLPTEEPMGVFYAPHKRQCKSLASQDPEEPSSSEGGKPRAVVFVAGTTGSQMREQVSTAADGGS